MNARTHVIPATAIEKDFKDWDGTAVGSYWSGLASNELVINKIRELIIIVQITAVSTAPIPDSRYHMKPAQETPTRSASRPPP